MCRFLRFMHIEITFLHLYLFTYMYIYYIYILYICIYIYIYIYEFTLFSAVCICVRHCIYISDICVHALYVDVHTFQCIQIAVHDCAGDYRACYFISTRAAPIPFNST